MSYSKDTALNENGIEVNDDEHNGSDLSNLSKDHRQYACKLDIGFESGLDRHNGDGEVQEADKVENKLDTTVKTNRRGDPALNNVSNDDDISIEIVDCDWETNLGEVGSHLKTGLNKYMNNKNSDSDVNKIDNSLDGCDTNFAEGMHFGRMVENIYFLDEDELKEEHEKDKQRAELLMDLDVEKKQETVDVTDSNKYSDVGLERPLESGMASSSLNKDLENNATAVDMSDTGHTEGPFSYLPDELLVKILAYLNTQQLCRHASPVCKKWREIAKEPTLWKSINFNCNPEMESLNLLWVLRKAPLLRNLVLRGRTNITHPEVAILSEMCPMLADLDLGFCDNLSCDMIQSLVENCKSLKKINVEGCNKIDHNCVKCLSKCKKLSYLNFSHCFLQDESLTYLADHLSQIASVNLDGISWITDRGVSSLVSKHYNHLVELELDGAEITDAGIRNIVRCKELEILEISFCEYLSDDSLLFLKDLEKLRELKLRKGSSFTKEGMSEFFRTVTLTHLEGLNLSECTCIDDSIVLDIVKCCGSHLTFLSLCWCWFITDTGLVSIVDHCGKLETLELLGIDKITGMCLDRVPEEIPNLTLLDLRQCNKIVDSLIEDMIRKKPDLKVFNYYGEEFVHQRG